MFSQFTQLKSLDLQQNDISMVEDEAFNGLSQLTTLLLQHNGLRTASEEVLLPMPRLAYLRIYDNPWSCRCSLDSLVRTLQVPSKRSLGNYAKCDEPLWLRGQKLKKLSVEALCTAEIHEGSRPGGGGGGDGGQRPPPVKLKPEATSMCRTYMFPRPLLDCSSKGEAEVCLIALTDGFLLSCHNIQEREAFGIFWMSKSNFSSRKFTILSLHFKTICL